MDTKKAPTSSTPNWVKASGGMVPENGFAAGYQKTGEKLFIARAPYGGGVHVGKVRPEFEGCLLPYGGAERHCGEYEVLEEFNVEWVKDIAGHVPPFAIKGGYEEYGPQLYIGRVHFDGGVHIGKVGEHLNGCNFSWGGKELSMAQYEVLVAERYWIDADMGNIPEGSLVGGTVDGKPLYVGRAKFKGGVQPGKIWGTACLFPYGGKQLYNSEYQVLRNVPGKWVAAADGEIPQGALHCGRESDGKPLYLARGEFSNGQHSGKIRPGFEGAHVSWGGEEHSIKKYEVFVPDSPIGPEFTKQ